MPTAEQEIQGRHGTIPIRRYPAVAVSELGNAPAPLVWLHGGAFSHGGLDQPESHAPAVAVAASGREVITVDYRRVPPWSALRDPKPGRLPGVRFPIPVEDVLDVLKYVSDSAGGAVLGGASAGACLAAAAALHSRLTSIPAPRALVLAYGTFHAKLPPLSAEIRSRTRGVHGLVQFRSKTVERMNRNYAGSAKAMGDPLAFPGGHHLAGLPPTLVLDADRDTLRASGSAFAHELKQAGVLVNHQVVPNSSHGFLNRPSSVAFNRGAALMLDWLAHL